LGELESEENVPVMKIDDGGGSGGAPMILELAPGGLGIDNLRLDKLGEPLVNQKRKKEGRRGSSFTGGGDDTAAARNKGGDNGERGVLKRVCLQGEGKGASRSSGSTLNSDQERGRRGEAEGACGSRRLPLKAADISGRSGRKGNGRV
jgi:hypothetical protein